MIPEANIVFTAAVPVEVGPGMSGLALTVDDTPSSVPLPAGREEESVFTLYFDGPFAADVWFAVGDANTRATLADPVVPRGRMLVFSLSVEGRRCTHISLRTRSGTVQGTLNFYRRGS